MINNTINLSPKYPNAKLTTYVPGDDPELCIPPRPAMIVCPGGGYKYLSAREAEPIALRYLAAGFSTFLLEYDTEPIDHHYTPLIEAGLAIKYVREHAEEYHVNPDLVFICGFSAGGHLAATAGSFWSRPEIVEAMGDAPYGINKPTGTVLSYPVLSSVDHPHIASFKRLCGTETPSEELLRSLSLELNVTSDTVPAFIWHTFEDKTVPVENALVYARALREKNIPFELHIYPYGPHATALATPETWCGKETNIRPEISTWAELSVNWVKGFIK